MSACLRNGSTARHDSDDIVFTFAGGGDKFRIGRYLKTKPENSAEVAHNKLLVSILEPTLLLLEEQPPAVELKPILDAIGMGAHRVSKTSVTQDTVLMPAASKPST